MDDTQTSDKPRFLVLDDESLTAQTISQMAMEHGFDAKFTIKPSEFFNLLDDWFPDIIAIDLLMPEMDGVQVMEHLAYLGCRAKLIITSGVGGKILSAAGRSAEAHGLDVIGILSKPFSATKLNSLLKGKKIFPDQMVAITTRSNSPQTLLPTAQDLEKAINSGQQISVAYQPKIFCKTGTLAGFEALARWHHPELGKIAPDVFIAIAEQHHLIDKLTQIIAEQVIDWLADVSQQTFAQKIGFHTFQNIKLSLNISASSINNRVLFDWLIEYCEQKNIDPQRLVLELTETSAMQDPMTSLDNLTRLRMRGFHLSIDDFGTGYSSMAQLVRLPFSEIKVDKSFVINASESEESRTIIKSIVDLGNSLQMNTTAEGIEDLQTLKYMKKINCEMAQGYLISPPMPSAEIENWFLERENLREISRIESLNNTNLFDTPAEERFDRITRLTQKLFNTAFVLVSFIDVNRQWFKSKQGLDVSETPRDIAFCAKAIENDFALIVQDAKLDRRFKDNPLVTGFPHIRFYAGQPISLPDGNKVGTLCIIDQSPRMFDKEDQNKLKALAQLIEQELTNVFDNDTVEYHTGLLNRETFKSRAESGLTLCKKLRLRLTIIAIKLPGLALVNHQFGKQKGDEAIRGVAEFVTAVSDQKDLLGRYRNTKIGMLFIGLDETEAHLLLVKLQEQKLLWEQKHPDIASILACNVGMHSSIPSQQDALEKIIEQSFSA